MIAFQFDNLKRAASANKTINPAILFLSSFQ